MTPTVRGNGKSRVVAVLLVLLFTPGASAQRPVASDIDVTASLRVRAEYWRWFEAPANHEYGYVGSTLRAGLMQSRSSFGWQLEMAAPLLFGLPSNAVAPAPQGQLGVGASYAAANGGDETAAGLFLKQGYIRLGVAPGRRGHSLRGGRFEFVEGAETTPSNGSLAWLKRERIAHRLLGTFAWSHVGRSLDGAQYNFAGAGTQLTAAVARPTQGVFKTRGWPGLDMLVAYGALTIAGERAEGRVFGLHIVDDRQDPVKTDNRPSAVRTADRDRISVTTVGGHYLRILPAAAGDFDVLLWGVTQFGDWGEQDHEAWAGAVELGFQPAGRRGLSPWIRAGYFASSGDADPGDDTHGTFFQALPTPRIYARTPFYNLMNLRDAFASVQLRPGSRFALRAEAHALRLSESRDLWYAGGGAFERETFGFAGRPSGEDRELAMLYDIGVDVGLGSGLSASAYAGFVEGRDVIENIHPLDARARLLYLELNYRR
jgi:hypothetical protein